MLQFRWFQVQSPQLTRSYVGCWTLSSSELPLITPRRTDCWIVSMAVSKACSDVWRITGNTWAGDPILPCYPPDIGACFWAAMPTIQQLSPISLRGGPLFNALKKVALSSLVWDDTMIRSFTFVQHTMVASGRRPFHPTHGCLTTAEENKSSMELECLAVVKAIDHFTITSLVSHSQ